MPVHLVRHGKAEKRVRWDGPDGLRPLAPRGLRQARALATGHVDAGFDRIFSSPYLRCRQTVEPLAIATGLRVEVHECLAKDEPPAKATELLRSVAEERVLCCTHGELVDTLLAELGEEGVRVDLLPLDPAEGAPGEHARLGVLDMGSTSFHLLVADATAAGTLVPVDRERVMLRLGAVIATHREIPEEVGERAVATARALRRRAEELGAQRVLPVGTAALREARNGEAVAARIAEALGTPVRILSGVEEARLIFRAFRRRVWLPPHGCALGVDLGGGSLELAVGDGETLRFETTCPVGTARLHGELAPRDPMRKREIREVCTRVERALAPHRDAILGHAPALCVAAGGTARALGRLSVALRGLRPARSINELTLGLDELRAVTEILVRAPLEERLQLPGIRRRRADLLPVGALVLLTVAETLGLDGYTLTDWGLREGVLLEAVGGDA
jgi:exopolyphosphatase/guanosine-5'-triphosphate,3'-diphosphate pyrophosphatase